LGGLSRVQTNNRDKPPDKQTGTPATPQHVAPHPPRFFFACGLPSIHAEYTSQSGAAYAISWGRISTGAGPLRGTFSGSHEGHISLMEGATVG